MHHLTMKNMGPISNCEIDIDSFTVLTGAQASGKSTIAKSVFFFRTIKDDILEAIVKRSVSNINMSLYNTVVNQIRNKFLQIFGSSRAMDSDLCLKYNYSQDTSIEITLELKKGYDYVSPNYVFFTFSKNIKNFLRKYNNYDLSEANERNKIKEELNSLFCDDYETIFIPAGRSLITLLTTQLNYIFTIMDDEQRHSIDFCTQKYVERILKIRSAFDEGIAGYYEKKRITSYINTNQKFVKKCMDCVDNILKGRYKYITGEERLMISDDKYVKINYTSSGQQESVWIFNILMYQIINGTKSFIILEEPEAHLYPNAQKDIAELLSMFIYCGNSVMVTTHSPYMLGAFNNLLFANSVLNSDNITKIKAIIDEEKLLKTCASFYLQNGIIVDCYDHQNNIIKNEVIDGASEEINSFFDKLTEIENG